MKILYLLLIFFLPSCVTSGASQFSPQLEQGIELADSAVKDCIQRYKDGELKQYKETALCGNKAIKKHVIPHAEYPQLVREFMAYRLSIAEKIDSGKISYQEGRNMMKSKREELTAQGLMLRENNMEQEWLNEVRRDDPFKRVGCQFRPSGVSVCSDW